VNYNQKDMHKYILTAEKEKNTRIEKTRFYSRLAVSAIRDFKMSGDDSEYTRLWSTINAKVVPDLKYMELEIRYSVVKGDLDRAILLVKECSKIFETECPRRPGISIVNIVFHACLENDRIKNAEELVRISKELGHDYEANARWLCKYYIERNMSECVWKWMREYLKDCSSTRFALVTNDIRIANNILTYMMEQEGFQTGVEVAIPILSSSFMTPTTRTETSTQTRSHSTSSSNPSQAREHVSHDQSCSECSTTYTTNSSHRIAR
jgi:hypothetical protein